MLVIHDKPNQIVLNILRYPSIDCAEVLAAHARPEELKRPGSILDRLTVGTAELLSYATPMHDQEGLTIRPLEQTWRRLDFHFRLLWRNTLQPLINPENRDTAMLPSHCSNEDLSISEVRLT
jgi:hypothetical protein